MSRRKAPEDRQSSNRPRDLRLVLDTGQGATSPKSDLPALRRLYDLINRQTLVWRIFDREPLVTGSTGQPVIHKAGRLALQLETPIRHLEDRFGLSPRARLGLRVQFGPPAASLQKLAEGAGADFVPGPDPRTLEV